MPSADTPDIKPLITSMFAGVEAKNVDAATAPMADDVELFDPHYPYPDMHGVGEVREGLTWAFGGMKSMGFDIERWFLSKDGLSATVEVATHHVLNQGSKHLDFPQVFVIDTDGTKITPDARLRALRTPRHDGLRPGHRPPGVPDVAHAEEVGAVTGTRLPSRSRLRRHPGRGRRCQSPRRRPAR